MWVHVQDVHDKPLKGVQIGIKGLGGSGTSGNDGNAKIALPSRANQSDWVELQVTNSPPGRSLEIISPYHKVQIPPFQEKPMNFVEVVVVQQGTIRSALKIPRVARTLAQQVTADQAATVLDERKGTQGPRASLKAVAAQYGLAPDELDQAIKAWGATTKDPRGAGVIAFYERKYPQAINGLEDSLGTAEGKLKQRDSASNRDDVADAASLLGAALLAQGRYGDAAKAYERALQIRPGDQALLNNAGLSLLDAGDTRGAEADFQQALTANDKSSPSTSVTTLNNLARLREAQGRYSEAEQYYRQALTLSQRVFGPNDPRTATVMNNLAGALESEDKSAEAEDRYKEALKIREAALGRDHPEVAQSLNNLGYMLLKEYQDCKKAEPMLTDALAIKQSSLGLAHPSVAYTLDNLAYLQLLCYRNTGQAEGLYREALSIRENALGKNHPEVAENLATLSLVIQHSSHPDCQEAERLLNRALSIDENVLGPQHPKTRVLRSDLEGLRYTCAK
jgi:tetratricopeptide (TPR) repeat protein